jgi:hypothetical protein
MLKRAGHKVTTVFEVNLVGMSDYDVLMYAIKTKHILFTQNCEDFVSLSEAVISSGGNHPGIILLYKNNNQKKDMSYQDIVKAIDNLIKTGVPIPGSVHRLNQYHF